MKSKYSKNLRNLILGIHEGGNDMQLNDADVTAVVKVSDKFNLQFMN
jgi:hypothetical protein